MWTWLYITLARSSLLFSLGVVLKNFLRNEITLPHSQRWYSRHIWAEGESLALGSSCKRCAKEWSHSENKKINHVGMLGRHTLTNCPRLVNRKVQIHSNITIFQSLWQHFLFSWISKRFRQKIKLVISSGSGILVTIYWWRFSYPCTRVSVNSFRE
jgi:hypothetical protein